MGPPDRKMAPRPQKRPTFAKIMSELAQKSTFCSDRGSDSCYIGNQPLYFQQTILGKVFRAQDGV